MLNLFFITIKVQTYILRMCGKFSNDSVITQVIALPVKLLKK